MSEMIERVAKALVDADCSAEGLTFKELSRHMARAAIEAMREPNEEMVKASRMARANIEGGYGGPSSWEAAINAALD